MGEFKDLICVRMGSRIGTVVLLPGLGAPPSQMDALAEKIGGDGAVYILDLLALAGIAEGALSVEWLADRSLALVNGAGGADAVVGYSFGGLVAFEMARLARAAGDGTPEPILIDAAPEQSHWPQAVWLRSILARSVEHIGAASRLSPSNAIADLSQRAAGLAHRARRRRRASLVLEQAHAGPAQAGTTPHERMLDALNVYSPKPFDGPMTLLELSEPPFSLPVSVIWRPLVAKLRVYEYPGGHLDAFRSESHHALLARQLNACLGMTA